MKIERLSENQIRCTLSKADLADKELKISELAYGTAKARELFKEMMQQASNEVGFETDDIPLMIEAIPISSDCLILIVTKVEDPEELDTRFSRFSNVSEFDMDVDEDETEDEDFDDDLDFDDMDPNNSPEANNISPELMSLTNNIVDSFEDLVQLANDESAQLKSSNSSDDLTGKDKVPDASPEKKVDIFRIFAFKDIDTIIKASKIVVSVYMSDNTLYKNPLDNCYYLLITKNQNTAQEFSRVCSILGEYGKKIKISYAMPLHFKEHYKLILEHEALQTLSAL